MDCQVIGERSDAVLRPAMPGDDVERAEDDVDKAEEGDVVRVQVRQPEF